MSTTTLARPDAPATASHPAIRRTLLLVGALAAAGLTATVLSNSRDEFAEAADALTDVTGTWLGLAVAVELVSYGLYAAAQRRLLQTAGVRLGLVPLTGIAVLAQAAADCLPGGVAVSVLVTVRRLARRAVDPVLSTWVVSVTSLLYAGALALLALVGAQLAGPAGAVPDLRLVSLVVLGAGAVGVALLLLLRRRLLAAERPLAERLPTRLRPVVHRIAELRAVRLPRRTALVALLLLVLCWLTDAGVLAASFGAVGAAVPWRGLLVAYCAAQLAATLPFTPGGLGVVEGSLTVALVAYGGDAPSTLAAVLLYRLISFWGLLPAGGLAYLALRRSERRPVPA